MTESLTHIVLGIIIGTSALAVQILQEDGDISDTLKVFLYGYITCVSTGE